MSVHNFGSKFLFESFLPSAFSPEDFLWIPRKLFGFSVKASRNKRTTGAASASLPEVLKGYRTKPYSRSSPDYDELKFAYIFEKGSVILWNFSEAEEREALLALMDHVDKKIIIKSENYFYIERKEYAEDPQTFVTDYVKSSIIFLRTSDPGEKQAYSFSLHYSIKLEETEEKINGVVDAINLESSFDLLKFLLYFQKKRHFRRLGNLYLIRAEAKFDFNALQHDFFNNTSDEFVPQFKAMNLYNGMKSRIEVAQKRFETLMEVFDQVTLEASNKNSYMIYYYFIFWILTAIALIIIQEIFDISENKERSFRIGFVGRGVATIYGLLKGTVVWFFDRFGG